MHRLRRILGRRIVKILFWEFIKFREFRKITEFREFRELREFKKFVIWEFRKFTNSEFKEFREFKEFTEFKEFEEFRELKESENSEIKTRRCEFRKSHFQYNPTQAAPKSFKRFNFQATRLKQRLHKNSTFYYERRSLLYLCNPLARRAGLFFWKSSQIVL